MSGTGYGPRSILVEELIEPFLIVELCEYFLVVNLLTKEFES